MSNSKKEMAWNMYETLSRGNSVAYLVFRVGCYTPAARIHVKYGRSAYGVSCRGAGALFPSVAFMGPDGGAGGADSSLPVSVASARCRGCGYDMKGEVVGEIVRAWAADVPGVAAMLTAAESRESLGGLGAFGLLSAVFAPATFRVVEA